MKKRVLISTLISVVPLLWGTACDRMATTGKATTSAYENYISYITADWGPGGDTIYFIKQIITTKAEKTEWLGCHFWLCKMQWDGSAKQEIAELWPGQNASIDLQGSPMWMEVNAATSNIAFGVKYGNALGFGVWVVGMDGKNLRRPFDMIWNQNERWVPVHPSWSPDGTKLVYEEINCTEPTSSGARLVLYDLQKKERRQLTDGPHDEHPVWSPKGDWIAYTHYLQYDNRKSDRRIWRIRPDGSEQKPVLDVQGKPIKGWWSSWNPEGTKVSINNGLLVMADVTTNKTERIDPLYILGARTPYLLSGHHWGKHGWLLCAGPIRLINLDKSSGRNLAMAGVYKFTDPNSEEARWGSAPSETHGKAR